MRCHLPVAATTLLLAIGIAPVRADGLSAANYVEIGESIVAMRTATPLPDVVAMQTSTDSSSRTGVAPGRTQPASPASERFLTRCRGGGFVEGSTTLPDEGASPSPKTLLRTTFHRCRAESETLSGSQEMVATTRIDGAIDTVRIDIRFTNLGSERIRWVGPTTVVWRSNAASGTEHGLVTYRDLLVVRKGRTYRWSGGLETERAPFGIRTVRFVGTVAVGRSALQLNQLDPFVFAADGRPRAGVLEVTDEEGNSLIVLAGPEGYAYGYLPVGVGGPPDVDSQGGAVASR